ncbi:MAG: hypothetical protein KF912_02685 [Phycisphaeraceae bacterium]|nr:hypothetical protein [Phycisphaeraceae bacterium]MBX3366206.1 hypothetical protein [Phycisphaeraceae bacterium]
MSNLFLHDLSHFTGDLTRYQHPLNANVIYTPGVRHVAREGDAYWLLDAIAFQLGSPEFKQAVAAGPRIGDLHFWKLCVRTDRSAQLIARADSDVAPFLCEEIRFTDFPLDVIDIWAGFSGGLWTLYLPSEH